MNISGFMNERHAPSLWPVLHSHIHCHVKGVWVHLTIQKVALDMVSFVGLTQPLELQIFHLANPQKSSFLSSFAKGRICRKISREMEKEA